MKRNTKKILATILASILIGLGTWLGIPTIILTPAADAISEVAVEALLTPIIIIDAITAPSDATSTDSNETSDSE